MAGARPRLVRTRRENSLVFDRIPLPVHALPDGTEYPYARILNFSMFPKVAALLPQFETVRLLSLRVHYEEIKSIAHDGSMSYKLDPSQRLLDAGAAVGTTYDLMSCDSTAAVNAIHRPGKYISLRLDGGFRTGVPCEATGTQPYAGNRLHINRNVGLQYNTISYIDAGLPANVPVRVGTLYLDILANFRGSRPLAVPPLPPAQQLTIDELLLELSNHPESDSQPVSGPAPALAAATEQ